MLSAALCTYTEVSWLFYHLHHHFVVVGAVQRHRGRVHYVGLHVHAALDLARPEHRATLPLYAIILPCGNQPLIRGVDHVLMPA
jgi:hypothetical protein